MVTDVDEIRAARDQLREIGRRLTVKGIPSGDRKRAVRIYCEMVGAFADRMVTLAMRHEGLVQENAVLRARLGDADERQDQGQLL